VGHVARAIPLTFTQPARPSRRPGSSICWTCKAQRLGAWTGLDHDLVGCAAEPETGGPVPTGTAKPQGTREAHSEIPARPARPPGGYGYGPPAPPPNRARSGVVAAKPLVEHARVLRLRLAWMLASITPQPAELAATLPTPLGRLHAELRCRVDNLDVERDLWAPRPRGGPDSRRMRTCRSMESWVARPGRHCYGAGCCAGCQARAASWPSYEVHRPSRRRPGGILKRRWERRLVKQQQPGNVHSQKHQDGE
jgi:hypothetical protein